MKKMPMHDSKKMPMGSHQMGTSTGGSTVQPTQPAPKVAASTQVRPQGGKGGGKKY